MALYWGKWTVSRFGCIIPWVRGTDFNIHTLYIYYSYCAYSYNQSIIQLMHFVIQHIKHTYNLYVRVSRSQPKGIKQMYTKQPANICVYITIHWRVGLYTFVAITPWGGDLGAEICRSLYKQTTPHSAHSLLADSQTSQQLQQDRKP
jgi:hypothetical protein